MTYRDTAIALAQRAPGNFLGVALYVPMGDAPARWDAVALMSSDALADWYAEIAGAPTLYYYVVAFDKSRSAQPVGESIAPPKPGDPGWATFETLRRSGYQWRPGAFVYPKAKQAVSGEADVNLDDHGPRLAKIAKTGLIVFGAMWLLSGITYNPRPEDILRDVAKPRKHWSQN